MTPPNLPGGLRVEGPARAGVCGTWWRAVAPDGSERDALRLDSAAAGVAERLTAAVRAVNALHCGGFLVTTEPIRDGDALWLVTTQPTGPTLADLAHARIDLDIGSVAAMANETARSLVVLHAAGLTHGALYAQTVTISDAGAVKVAETALAPALRAMSSDPVVADRWAWAQLIRTMVAQRGGDGPAVPLLLRCAALGERDLAEARRALSAGASTLALEVGGRAGLVAAVATYQGARTQAVATQAVRTQAVATEAVATEAVATEAVQTEELIWTQVVAASEPTAHLPAALTGQHTAPMARETAVAGQRPVGAAVPQQGDEIRFGPGVPAVAPVAPAWRLPPPAPARRRSTWRLISSFLSTLLTIALLAAVGLYLWQRISPLEITTVAIAVPDPPGDRCDVTVDVVATVQTNGNAGVIRYQWLRSGAEPSGLLTEQVGRGQRTVTLPLKWSFGGVGTTKETATINITSPSPVQAQTGVTYNCRRR